MYQSRKRWIGRQKRWIRRKKRWIGSNVQKPLEIVRDWRERLVKEKQEKLEGLATNLKGRSVEAGKRKREVGSGSWEVEGGKWEVGGGRKMTVAADAGVLIYQ